MKFNQWTLALASVGAISLGSVAQAEEQHSVMTALSSTTLSGYVDTSVMWKAGSGGVGAALPGRSFDGGDKSNGFNLHVIKLTLEKPLDEAENWSAGYKTDLVFGPDANYYGTLINGGGAPANDDFAVKQAYVALRAPVGNGLDFKMGVFDTVVGYEFYESGSNPNFSRSYGYFIEPTHHTGLLASYNIAEGVAITGGVANTAYGPVNGRHMPNGIESKLALLGALNVTLAEAAGPLENSTFTIGYVGGPAGMATTKDTHNLYAGATFNLGVEGLQLGLAWDYREDIGGTQGANDDTWAAAVYLGYGVDKWSVNLRADYSESTDGLWYGGFGNTAGRDEIGSLTATIGYQIWENVLTRLEGRLDKAFSDEKPFGMADEHAITVALNAVYKF